MNYGLIPILSDLKANSYWIDHQKNGFLVKNDLHQIADTIDYVIDNINTLKESMIPFNQNLVQEKGDFNKNMEKELVSIVGVVRR